MNSCFTKQYGKKESNSENIDSASDLAEDVLEKCHNGEIRLFTIQSTVSIEKGSPDGQGGFLLAYQSKAGSAYAVSYTHLTLPTT